MSSRSSLKKARHQHQGQGNAHTPANDYDENHSYGYSHRYSSTSAQTSSTSEYPPAFEPVFQQHHRRPHPPLHSPVPISHSAAYGPDNVRVLNGSPLHEHDEHERRDAGPSSSSQTIGPSSSPARPMTPPRSPSPAYLSTTVESPTELDSSALARKLLVLDLNGTLCLRAAHKRAKAVKQPPSQSPAESSQGSDRLRVVHPRPYMRTFCAYLFAQSTRAWLDVMVWSSARPHSVDNMVETCFGERGRAALVAVWARDTLGLSVERYNAKVQTHKDLSKPWAQLPSLIARHPQADTAPASDTNSDASSSRSTSSHRRKRAKHRSASNPGQSQTAQTNHAHSARTTLLLDDSPLKAVRQPWNHLCICEYTSAMRSRDLLALQAENARREAEEERYGHEEMEAVDEDQRSADAGSGSGSPESTKRKRERKKARHRTHVHTQPPNAEANEVQAEREHKHVYDETLLAIVGVLDAVKRQANVAAWVRAGGLWKSGAGPSTTENVGVGEEAGQTETTEMETEQTDEKQAQAQAPDQTEGEVGGKKARKKPRWRKSKKAVQLDGSSPASVSAGELAGNNAVIPVAPPSSVSGAGGDPSSASTALWFEDEASLGYWIGRGRAALDELGILAEHGMTR